MNQTFNQINNSNPLTNKSNQIKSHQINESINQTNQPNQSIQFKKSINLINQTNHWDVQRETQNHEEA